MKRIAIIAIGWAILAGLVLLASCADPLEPTGPNLNPEPIYIVDTITLIDTVMKYDTTNTFDTVTVFDTVTQYDTTFSHDTTWMVDTVTIVDTIHGGNHYDTVYVVDTLQVVDTVTLVDTVYQVDTLLQIDTVYVVDTLYVVDTISFFDTVYVTDTVTQVDTIIIVMPDTGGFRPFCGTLASNQQEIVWMFRNPEGDFRLEFTNTLERIQPGQSVTIDIDGQKYYWDVVADHEYNLDLHLQQNSTIRITANKPPARGHSIYICLQVTQL